MGTEEISDGVYAVECAFDDTPLNLYVVVGTQVALIDTGVAGTPRTTLAAGLESVGRRLSDIDIVVNTHGHHDHRGGNGELRSASPGARFLCHRADAEWIASTDCYLTGQYLVYRDLWEPPVGFIDRIRRLCGTDTPVDDYLDEGSVIDLGRGHRLSVRHFASHTEGHLALFDEKARVLFTGDALQSRGTPLRQRLGFFPAYRSVAEYQRSLDYFEACGAEAVATSHWGTCRPHHAAQLIQESRLFAQDLTEFLRALLQGEGKVDLRTATDRTLDTWPRYARGMQLYLTVAGHLDSLVECGLATREGTDSATMAWCWR